MLAFLRRVWELARPYRVRLFLGVLTGFLAGVTGPMLIATITLVSSIVFPAANGQAQHIKQMPAFLQPWLERARDGMGTGLREHWVSVVLLVATIPLVMVVSRVLGYLNTYFLQWTAIRVINDLRTKLFTHLLSLSTGFFNQTSTGELISRIMNDTSALQSIISNSTSVIVRDPITLIGIMGYLLWRQPAITLISLAVLPICMIPLSIYSKKVRQASRGLQNSSSDLMQVMTETFTGLRVVKAYNLEKIVGEEFRQTAANSVSNYMRIIRSNELSGPIIDFLASVGIALALLYMIYMAQAHPDPGDFIQLAASIFYMYAPMKNLTRLHNQLSQARAGCEQVFALLATKNSVPEPVAPKKLNSATVKKSSFRTLTSPSRPANSSHWWAPVAQVKPPWRTSSCAFMTQPEARSRLAGWICGRCQRATCATRLRSWPRKIFCSTIRFAETLSSAGSVLPTKRLSLQRDMPSLTILSWRSQRVLTPSLVKRVFRFPAASGSAWPSPAQS
jgi:ABC-type multidrug transport system fused ATPase/permease subunit